MGSSLNGRETSQWDGNAIDLGVDKADGVYSAGPDDLVMPGRRTARIMTLRGGPISDGSITYSEYQGTNFLVQDSDYLVSVPSMRVALIQEMGWLFLANTPSRMAR